MMRRYLLISDEVKMENGKSNTNTHFDIIPTASIGAAIRLLRFRRPQISRFTHLSLPEIESIYFTMLDKTDLRLMEKFLENTK